MAFCTKCGKQIAPGEQCSCTMQAGGFQQPQGGFQQPQGGFQQPQGGFQQPQGGFQQPQGGYQQPPQNSFGNAATGITTAVSDSFKSMRDELKSKDAYERGMKIVPDTVAANESEIPVKQYDHIARLRSRASLKWADGKMQLTNKRLIFRAPGRSLLAGKQVLQHEFAVDDISGIELRRDHRFNFLDLIFALLTNYAGIMISTLIFMAIYREVPALGVIIGLIAGVAMALPLFLITGYHPYLKLFSFSGTIGAFVPLLMSFARLEEAGIFFMFLFGTVLGIVDLILILKIVFVPNLNITIKTQSGTGVIEIRHRAGVLANLFGGGSNEYTGYDEVLPGKDTDRAVKELGAMINDIQKLGDFAVEKWKDK